LGCDQCFDDYTALLGTSPDVVLVEVPHGAQDSVVLWALEQGLHVMIGGCLAASCASAEEIRQMASSRGLVVEAGYQCRYTPLWEEARSLVREGQLGEMVAVRSIALYDADPHSWYYRQNDSGGMPLTHMTYGFINPLRWLFGDPLCVSAFANRLRHTGPGMVNEETCAANLRFANDLVCSMTASFVMPGRIPGWSVLFLGTECAMEVFPSDDTLTLYQGPRLETKRLAARDPFEVQAEVFVGAMDGLADCRNSPEETVGDIKVAEAIVTSAREKRVLWL
jgi:predicted dehydrogenase